MAQFCVEEALIAVVGLQDARADSGMGEDEMIGPPVPSDPVLAGQIERQRIFAQAAE